MAEMDILWGLYSKKSVEFASMVEFSLEVSKADVVMV